MARERQLTTRERKFVAELLKGKSATQAAIDAGYSQRSAKYCARSLLHDNELVKVEIARIRQNLADSAEYNAERFMADLDRAIEFAEKTENANAFVNAVMAKGKHAGHLREKVDVTVERIDIGSALSEARARVLRPICDPRSVIDVIPVALPSPAGNGPVDNESTAPRGWPVLDVNL